MEILISIINAVKASSKPILGAIFVFPWILSIPFIQKIIPSLSKFLEEDWLWLSSTFSFILLLIYGFINIYKWINSKAREYRIKNNEKNILIKKLMDRTNTAKYVLCDFFTNHPKGNEIYCSYQNNQYQNFLNELVENNILCCHHSKISHRASYGGDHYWISPDIYTLLSKNQNKIYKKIRASIPNEFIEEFDRKIKIAAQDLFDFIINLSKEEKNQINFLYKNIERDRKFRILLTDMEDKILKISALHMLYQQQIVAMSTSSQAYEYELAEKVYNLFDRFPNLYAEFINNLDN
ncbi:hypothetical protein [Wohlfahrtiimonas larvae]|uniref:Uncharacterized protein n=1 Tax=Wohlfahrtiimonas larvae TaxID=1157986 RepID=A0ABP9MGD8_9GAMM|nr:hypothetical protein [Wohlfahrtiimonas larvae]